MVLEPVETDIADLMRTGERWEQERARLEGIELRVEMPRSDLRWTVDPTRLKQAIVNLVSNAVKFTPRGGPVTLAAFEENDRIVIRVGDTGFGMTVAPIAPLLQHFPTIYSKER